MATLSAEKSGLSRGSSLQHLVIMLIISSSAESLSISGRNTPLEADPPLPEAICGAHNVELAPDPFPLVFPATLVGNIPPLPPPLPAFKPTSGVLLHLRTPSTMSEI